MASKSLICILVLCCAVSLTMARKISTSNLDNSANFALGDMDERVLQIMKRDADGEGSGSDQSNDDVDTDASAGYQIGFCYSLMVAFVMAWL